MSAGALAEIIDALRPTEGCDHVYRRVTSRPAPGWRRLLRRRIWTTHSSGRCLDCGYCPQVWDEIASLARTEKEAQARARGYAG